MKRRQHLYAGPACPSGRDHGPLLQMPSGRWFCPHSEHNQPEPAAVRAPIPAAIYDDAAVGL